MTTTPTARDSHTDRVDLVDLVSRLGRCLDTRDFDGLRDVFAPDGRVVTLGGTAEGHDALVAQAARKHSQGNVWHSVTGHVIDLDGDTATIRANLLVAFAEGVADPAPFLLGEVYDMEAQRGDRGWRLTRMSATPVWSLNNRLPAA
ncbi:nuclear transport factor 2 family protein [Mumia sp. zg.B53]|uniref:nuclear transport factor 2 family protein n=1 Tax=unclassified Mumia TaxID=2621872 RepID=UPI001C6F18E5|nr:MULTISPECIES: nuclear transport factor 2 family protein [unclassified Mumia]MBW9210330.1 nuclear transport factor 2 family protein [Mumia sp. zg.B21]MBW9214946.1 nuclear transport factor 2 family protein [Mumia sp. zg.B53]